MTATPTEQWQCIKTLPECLLRMLEDEIACDVTFVIGEKANEVHAHKVILMSRSPVFYSMFEGALSEKGKIVISDIQKDAFVEFLRYLYTDKYKPNSNTVMAVLYCAKKYCVNNLSKECTDFLEENISPENVCTIFQAAHHFDEDDIKDECLSVFKDETNVCVECPDFLALPKECISTILSLDEVNCREEVIYESVMKWAGGECQRQGIDDSSSNHRVVLGDLLYKVRFPTLDPVYFSRNIAKSCLLSDLEKVSIFTYFNLKDESLISDFVSSKRFFNLFKVSRFQDVRTISGSSDLIHKIALKLSHDAILQGIQVYGSPVDQTTIKYTLSIKNSTSHVLCTETTSITTNANTVIYDIIFTQDIKLEKREVYTVEINQKSNPVTLLYSGTRGRSNVKYSEGRTVQFSSVLDSHNTDTLKGQMPGLFLSN